VEVGGVEKVGCGEDLLFSEPIDCPSIFCSVYHAVVKPDIVFFGEAMPSRFFQCMSGDCAAADLCLVIGTSLRVHPVASVPTSVGARCVRVLFNRECVGTEKRTADQLADLDERTVARIENAQRRARKGSLDDSSDSDEESLDEVMEELGGTPGGFRFGEYRDVFVPGDCDDGIFRFAKLLGWEEELRERIATARAAFDAAKLASAAELLRAPSSSSFEEDHAQALADAGAGAGRGGAGAAAGGGASNAGDAERREESLERAIAETIALAHAPGALAAVDGKGIDLVADAERALAGLEVDDDHHHDEHEHHAAGAEPTWRDSGSGTSSSSEEEQGDEEDGGHKSS
jgi:Sir2 family